MYVRNVEITDVKTESRDVNTLFFDHSFRFIPGQYVMVWIRGVDEIPMSLRTQMASPLERSVMPRRRFARCASVIHSVSEALSEMGSA